MYGEDYEPYFSIVIAAYQAETVIGRAIRSVLKQPVADWEVIVVDDGSRDRTMEEVLLFHDDRIRCIEVTNGGPAKARNRGIQKAKGKYILFLDADDTMEDECLELLQQRLTIYPTDVLIFGFMLYQKKTNQLHHNYHTNYSFDCYALNQVPVTELYSKNLLNQVWNKAYRREFLLENGLEMPDYRYGEDRLFVISCLEKAASISLSEKELYCYRIENENSLIHAWHENKFAICTLIQERITELSGKAADFNQGEINYMYVKGAFSCLVDACGRKSSLSIMQQIRYIRQVLCTDCLRDAMKACNCPNLPTRMVVLFMKSKSGLLNYGFIKTSNCIMQSFPDAMIRWKHRHREKGI